MLAAAILSLAVSLQPDLAALLSQIAAGLQAPPDAIELRVEAAREAARKKDILTWGAALMPEKFFKPPCHELHDYFVEVRRDEITSTVAPRGHAKTLVRCKVIPMFQALEETDPADFYLNIQATHSKGVLLNFSIKHEFETNPVIAALYGDVKSDVKWSDELFMLKSGVVFRGAGVGDSIRGMQFLDRRPRHTTVDDLYDEEDIDNPDRIEAKNKWFWSSLYPARAKGRDTSFHVQGTVAGENDLMLQLGDLSKNDAAIKHKEFSAIKEDGTPLWKELNTAEELEKERNRMGDAAFSRENLGDRSSRSTSLIPKEWLASWRRSPSEFRCDKTDDPYTLVWVKVGVDPSVGKKQNKALTKSGVGDPAAYARVWKLQPRRIPGALPVYFIDAIKNARLTMDERIEAAKDMVTTSRPDRRVRQVKVETIAGFDDIGTLIARSVGVPCEKVDSVDDKMLNLERHQVYFQNGRIFVNENIDGEILRETEKQLTTNKPVHDDIRDAIFLVVEDKDGTMRDWV